MTGAIASLSPVRSSRSFQELNDYIQEEASVGQVSEREDMLLEQYAKLDRATKLDSYWTREGEKINQALGSDLSPQHIDFGLAEIIDHSFANTVAEAIGKQVKDWKEAFKVFSKMMIQQGEVLMNAVQTIIKHRDLFGVQVNKDELALKSKDEDFALLYKKIDDTGYYKLEDLTRKEGLELRRQKEAGNEAFTIARYSETADRDTIYHQAKGGNKLKLEKHSQWLHAL